MSKLLTRAVHTVQKWRSSDWYSAYFDVTRLLIDRYQEKERALHEVVEDVISRLCALLLAGFLDMTDVLHVLHVVGRCICGVVCAFSMVCRGLRVI